MGREIKGYEHWVPQAKLDPDYRSKLTYIALKDYESLKEALLKAGKYVAWDTETSSLNPEEGFLVGISFCYDGHTGYYIPINHAGDTSLGKKAVAMFHKYLLSCTMTFLYNARFDMRFLS